jgi:hypothetical protein
MAHRAEQSLIQSTGKGQDARLPNPNLFIMDDVFGPAADDSRR